MPNRPRSALFLGMALVAAHVAVAQEVPLRYIAPDVAAGTSAAVVVDGSSALAHTVQIYPVDITSGGKIVGPARAEEQAEEVLDRLQRVLQGVKSGFDRLVKIDVYVARPEVILTFRSALARRMTGKGGPAISFVVGTMSHQKVLVSIDAVAATSHPRDANEVTRINPKVVAGQRTSGMVAILPAGSRVYISGQAAPGASMAQATRLTLEGLDQTLAHVGLDRSRVVRVKAFLGPMSAAAEVEREVVAFFGTEAVPPLTLVEWQSKNPIEIELIVAGDRKPAGNSVEYLTPPHLKPSPVFSRVARVNRGDLIYVSGLYGPAQTSGARQVESIFEVLGKHLDAAGSDFRHLVKATYYVTDEDASRAVNELRPRYYDPARPPAASKAAVAGVDAAGRTITLDMIAVVKPAGGGDQGRIAPRPPNVVLLLSDDAGSIPLLKPTSSPSIRSTTATSAEPRSTPPVGCEKPTDRRPPFFFPRAPGYAPSTNECEYARSGEGSREPETRSGPVRRPFPTAGRDHENPRCNQGGSGRGRSWLGFAGRPASVRGASITMTFAGLKQLEQVGNYYNGQTGSMGSGPGPAFGVTFSANASVLTDGKSYVGEPSAPEVMLLLNNNAQPGQPISATMDVRLGFVGDLFLFYGSIAATQSVQIFSGLDGTGMMLASMALPQTSMNTTAVFSGSIDISFSGLAHSAIFNGGNSQIVFDNIQINTVPEPCSLVLLTQAAFCGLVGLRRCSARVFRPRR